MPRFFIFADPEVGILHTDDEEVARHYAATEYVVDVQRSVAVSPDGSEDDEPTSEAPPLPPVQGGV